MDWIQIGTAALMVAMLFIVWPAAKHWAKNSPKGSAADWMSFAVPMIGIALFIALLVMLV